MDDGSFRSVVIVVYVLERGYQTLETMALSQNEPIREIHRGITRNCEEIVKIYVEFDEAGLLIMKC